MVPGIKMLALVIPREATPSSYPKNGIVPVQADGVRSRAWFLPLQASRGLVL